MRNTPHPPSAPSPLAPEGRRRTNHNFHSIPVARTWSQRFRGLIGRRDLFLFIPRCSSIHTFFMRAPIDVLFLDDKFTVIDIRHAVKPWRIAIGARGSKHVVELPAGEARAIAAGDVVIDSASG